MIWFLLIACSLGNDPQPPAGSVVLAVTGRHALAGDWRGLSGLGRDGFGGLLAVPERQGTSVKMRVGEAEVEELGSLQLVGVPEGLDVEAVTRLPDGRFVLGTEAHDDARSEDRVLVAEVVGDTLEVRETWRVSYAPFGVRADENRGVEGVCAAGEVVVGVGEQALKVRGGRAAPAWRIDAATGQSTAFRLALTTTTGKLAAADCSLEGATLRLWAVERHFAVMQISTWRLPAELDASTALAPEHTWDLGPALPDQPNLEGLVVEAHAGGGHRAIMVRDNDYGGVQGPSELFVVDLAPMPRGR